MNDFDIEKAAQENEIKFCSSATAERMAMSAWYQAQEIIQNDGLEHERSIDAALGEFRLGIGIGCTASLATTYEKKGPHQCFFSVCFTHASSAGNLQLLYPKLSTYQLKLDKSMKRTRRGENNSCFYVTFFRLKSDD